MMPMRRMRSPCCARAASGHPAAAAPPSSVMNSRRLTSDIMLPSHCPGQAGPPQLNLPQGGRKVLGPDLKYSESCFEALRDHVRLAQKSPHVDHRLAGEIEVAIGRMRRAQNEEIAAFDHVVEGQ